MEVWDFDPAETLREKFRKIFKIKGIRGARKLLKEIAITATMGQHENELVGNARIPLKVKKIIFYLQLFNINFLEYPIIGNDYVV